MVGNTSGARTWTARRALVWACVVACCLLFVCAAAGCAQKQTAAGANSAASTSHATVEAIPVVEVKTVTFPVSYFEKRAIDDPQAHLAQLGCYNVTENEDGSYSASMDKPNYDRLVADLYEFVKTSMDAIAGDETYPNATAVDYDEQFGIVTVLFTTSTLTAEETLVPYIPGELAVMYQTVAGLPLGCDVILVGPDGSELLNVLFPQATDNLSSAATASTDATAGAA